LDWFGVVLYTSAMVFDMEQSEAFISLVGVVAGTENI
jgi:hypothetical protein